MVILLLLLSLVFYIHTETWINWNIRFFAFALFRYFLIDRPFQRFQPKLNLLLKNIHVHTSEFRIRGKWIFLHNDNTA